MKLITNTTSYKRKKFFFINRMIQRVKYITLLEQTTQILQVEIIFWPTLGVLLHFRSNYIELSHLS